MNKYMKKAKENADMCLSAIIWANIREVYFGCTKNDAANIGFRDNAIYEFIKGNNNMLYLKQLDRDECIETMKKYQEYDGKIY